MSVSTFERLEKMELVECMEKVTLADVSLSAPEGIVEDVIMRVDDDKNRKCNILLSSNSICK